MIQFFCTLSLGTLATHSGYNTPFSFNSLTHDFHHLTFNNNYGPLGILDAIYGSDRDMRNWLAELKERDADKEGDFVKLARIELAKLE